MNIKSRVDRVEGVIKSMDKSKNVPVIIVEDSNDNPEILGVRAHGEIIFRGTEAEVEEFIRPYKNGKTVIIWGVLPPDSEGKRYEVKK